MKSAIYGIAVYGDSRYNVMSHESEGNAFLVDKKYSKKFNIQVYNV
jgi:hypothetical protein